MLFNKKSAEKFDVSPEASRSSSGSEEEYPSGGRLVIVVVALVLSVFLVLLTRL